MELLEREILEKYQVRKTKAQKEAFIRYLQGHFPELKTEDCSSPAGKNLVLGDVDTAQVLLTAHYDTCIRSFFPNLMIPLRPRLKALYGVLIILPMLVFSLLAGYLVYRLTGIYDLFLPVYLVVYFLLFGFKFLWGKANPHTVNDNTSGVITALRIWRSLTPEQQAKAAVVLFDNEEKGCKGSKWFHSQRKEAMESKLVLNFDCVGDGDHFILVATQDAETSYGDALKASFAPTESKAVTFASAKKASLSSDQKNFKRSGGIAAMHEHKLLKLCCGRIHTPKDTVLQAENIDYLTGAACRFLDAL